MLCNIHLVWQNPTAHIEVAQTLLNLNEHRDTLELRDNEDEAPLHILARNSHALDLKLFKVKSSFFL